MPFSKLVPTPALDAGESSVRVLRRIRLVFNAVKSHLQQLEQHAGIGGAQYWALSVVHATPGIGVTALAAAMDVHQTTASNLVRSLVAAGMLAAERKAADRRAVQLRLLAPGRRVLRSAPGPFAGALPQALQALDAHTLARLDHDLSLLVHALKPERRAAGINLTPLHSV